MAQNRVQAIPLISFASSSLTSSYQAIGTLSAACFLIRINNATSTAVTLSLDGVNDHEVIGNGTTETLNFQTNAQPQNQAALLPKGQIIYAKATAGTGTLYISGYYVAPGN